MIIGIKLIEKINDTQNLNQEEVEKILKYGSSKRQHESFSSLMMLQTILEEKGITNFKIKRMLSGKPYIDKANLHFNISHSHKFAVCAVSQSEVGIDIELISSRIRKIAPRFLHKDEINYHSIDNYSDSELTTQWTIKESFTKLTGHGLTMPFNKIKIERYNGYFIAKYDGYVAYIKTFKIDEYIVAVCSKNLIDIADQIVVY